MPARKIKEYLEQNKVHFSTIPHSLAYATREISHITHTNEKELAKTVIVFVGNKLVMVIVPSSDAIKFDLLKQSLHENDITLASEVDFSNKFPDCETGAMPPFGNLYNMEVYVDKSLANNKEIAFNAGTHTEIIRMSYKDFERLVKPQVIAATH